MLLIKLIRRDKELFRNLMVILLILVGIRLFYNIPVPGLNVKYFAEMVDANSALGFMNLLSGNGLSNLSVMMLNITPYITASIIMQLLGNIFPRLQEMQKGLKSDQKKYEKITVILGIVLAAAEATAIAFGYGEKGLFIHYTWYWAALTTFCWTLGSAAASLLGKHIQDRYNVNGISLILLMNVLAGYPAGILEIYRKGVGANEISAAVIVAIVSVAIMAGAATAAMFIFTYVVAESERKIRVVYAGKSQTTGFASADDLPIKLCPGSVVPVIFASSIMSTPVLVASAFVTDDKMDALWMRILSSTRWFNPSDWLPTVGVVIFIALIFAFSFYYVDFSMNPKEIAENLQKAGGTIPGIRPGKETAKYLKSRFNGVVFLGACALSIIAVIPIVLSGLFGFSRLSFFGTSVIISVGIICELRSKVEAKSHYGMYMGKGGLF